MIAHIDADSFFASVLTRKNPSLQGKPVLALGMGGSCVIAASYEAKAKGVKTGMTLRDALKLAPDALRIPSDFQETGLASQQIESILQTICPRMEQMSIDEWFLDLRTCVGGVPQHLQQWADALRQNILALTGLSVSIGIGPTKTLAKLAGEYRKPAGSTVIGTAPTLEDLLRDRPVEAICGIGPRRKDRCHAERWVTAWEYAQANPARIKALFGKPGMELWQEIRGECVYHVQYVRQLPQSISRARSFRPMRDTGSVWAHTLRHLEYTVLKMRRDKLACQGVSVWIRDGQYGYRSAHCKLPRPLNTEEELQPFVRRCFGDLLRNGDSCTQTGVALWNLVSGSVRQFSLFEEPQNALREERIQDSLDTLHQRFGRNCVTRGAALPAKTGTKRSFEMPIY